MQHQLVAQTRLLNFITMIFSGCWWKQVFPKKSIGLVLSILFALTGTKALAQSAEDQTTGDSIQRQEQNSKKTSPLGNPEDEMMARNAIKLDEHLRKEMLDRARDVADIASSVNGAFHQHQTLTGQEVKQLERMEKMTRKLRGDLGGEEAPVEIENYPTTLAEGLEFLKKRTDALREGVEKTPRHVINASLIHCSNEVLDVVRFVRKQLPH